MPHVIERAASGRAKCRGCSQTIARDSWRFGERLPNPFAEESGEMTHWFHLPCAAFRRPEALLDALAASADPIVEREALEREARLGVTHRRLPRVNTVERAPSGRAACRACRAPIEKGTWRITLLYYEDGRFVPSGSIHPACAREYLETTEILPRLRHFTAGLTDTDIEAIRAALGPS
jgi:hypothetical protein